MELACPCLEPAPGAKLPSWCDEPQRGSIPGLTRCAGGGKMDTLIPYWAAKWTPCVDFSPLFDAGVYRALRPRGPLDRAEEIEGAAFEGLVAQHLRAWIAYSGSDCKLCFWRTRKGVEVDFVVYGGGGFWAVEVVEEALEQRRLALLAP
ncbi:MAG: DUF4143 domain-containing protein [bacterium]|nr:DUF4143 domain-containing protein [bacterium]